MQQGIASYDEAWNAPDAEIRRSLLETALSEDCELIEPNGRFLGRQAIFERIGGFAARFPGAQVKIRTDIDAHNGFARYGWEIVNTEGDRLLEGIDVVEVGIESKLHRILMFFGALSNQ